MWTEQKNWDYKYAYHLGVRGGVLGMNLADEDQEPLLDALWCGWYYESNEAGLEGYNTYRELALAYALIETISEN